jgi:hypothetical protein
MSGKVLQNLSAICDLDHKIRELPEEKQDAAADAPIQHIDEIPTLRDQVAITECREATLLRERQKSAAESVPGMRRTDR